MLREKWIALNVYITKEERLKLSAFPHQQKVEQVKPRVSGRKEQIEIRPEKNKTRERI